MTYEIEIGWRGWNVGAFTIGISVLGGTDVLSMEWQLLENFTGTYDDLAGLETVRVRPLEFTVTRGRDQPRGPIREGTAVLKFFDPDGVLNPLNGTSPLTGKLKPMRPVRITATPSGGTPEVIFRGWTTEFEYDPDIGEGIATIHCSDSFLILGEKYPVYGPTVSGTANEYVQGLLTAINWSTEDTDLNDTLVLGPLDSSEGTRKLTEWLTDIVEVTQGMVFISRTGEVTLLARNDAIARTSAFVFDAAEAALPGVSIKGIVNKLTAMKEGGTEQTYIDTASIVDYGTWEGSNHISPLFFNDSAALSYAEWVVNTKKDGVAPMWQFDVVEGPAGYAQEIVSYDLGERITVNVPNLDARDFSIQKIVHTAKPGALHKTSWMLHEVPGFGASPFIIGTSVIGGPNVLV